MLRRGDPEATRTGDAGSAPVDPVGGPGRASTAGVVTLVLAMWCGPPAAAAVGATAAVLVTVAGRRARTARRWVLAAVAVGVVGSVHAERAWYDARTPDRLGPYTGWARLASDPDPRDASGAVGGPHTHGVGGAVTHVVFEIEGERFESWVRARGAQRRLAPLLRGEAVEVRGERRPIGGHHPDRVRVRHVVGSFALDEVGASGPASPLDRAANRVRRRIVGAAHGAMPADVAALFTGLVIGDDTRQSDAMVAEFRAAGLSHLTAVSGQNISFVLAVAGLGLRRLRPGWRWVATIAIIGWFVVLTRVEPSVLRAGVMAAWAATGFALGQARHPQRMLVLTVGVLVLVDPLLAWSVGFWLSVGATAGVLVVGPRLRALLGGPTWLAEPLAVTLGAQAGVIVPALLVFGSLAPLGVPANLLAVPVAGAVMLVGLPLAIAVPLLPDPLDDIVVAPVTAGVVWVRTVAALAARLQPHGAAEVLVWAVQAGAVIWLARCGWRRRAAAVERCMSP